MSQCPGCGISYCLDCEEGVDPRVYRCEPCRIAYDANDPFAQTARELAKEVDELRSLLRGGPAKNKELLDSMKRDRDNARKELSDIQRRNKDLDAENIMCRRVNAELREQIKKIWEG